MLFFQCENLHVCLARVSDLSIFSIWAGRWWRASAWRLIYGVSLATRPVTSAEKCWPEPIHDHYTIPSTFYVSWSAIFINQFLKFPFVRLTKKVWNKFIINAPNRGMMALSIWPCKVRQKSSVSPSTNYLTMGWPFLGVAMQLSCTHIHFCLWPKQKGKMSDSYVTIFWWLQTKDAGSLKLHFFLMNFKGGWKYIRQLFTLERNHRTGLGAPAISKPHTAAAILNQILWPYSWFLAHWKPKKWPYIGLCP